MTAAMEAQLVSPSEIRGELARILASSDFAASRQLTSFLRFIVDESLAGRGDYLKERTVACGALARDSDFDPRLDSVVRVAAGKLRRTLERYYAQQGAADALCIEVPKGSYCPGFRRRRRGLSLHESPEPAPSDEVAATGGSSPVIAVAPIKALTGGSKERFLADLLADDVVVRLGRLSGLEVIDCLATRSPGTEDLCKTANRLHANFIFGGTVSRVGAQVRLTVRLVDGHSGVLAWGDQFDRRIDNGPLVQQDDIADSIATSIGLFFELA